jgi:hypothetical protein
MSGDETVTDGDASGAPIAGRCARPAVANGGVAPGRPRPGTAPAEGTRGVPAFGPGATLGRYLLLKPLGAGATGVVYSAFDPELDRKVALNVLHAVGEGGARSVHQARAMARVSHANVVRVYDAGEQGGRSFVVSELVEGGSLRDAAAAGSWRLVFGLYVKAGRGLAAVHGAGLVHGNFTPESVLVGARGEVRVNDVGLATARHPPAGECADRGADGGRPGPAEGEASAPAAGLRYRAPEQLRGEAADARSDQFAFCVALYEALFGEGPFAGRTASELLAAIEAGRPRRPRRGRRPPARAWRAIERGLSAEAAQRHPSMAALLDELTRVRGRRAHVAAALLAACAAPAVAYGARRARRAGLETACAAEGAAAARAWDAARAERVRRAFAATGLPYADDAARSAVGALERYAAAWSGARAASCRATRVTGEQAPDAHALRARCFDARLGEFDALVARFEGAGLDADVVLRAGRAARELVPVARCDDLGALLSAPEPAASGEALAAARRSVAEAKAGLATGEIAAGLEAGRRAVAAAEALGYAPLTSEALLVLGELETRARAPEAEGRLVEAFRVADLARDDRARARAASALAYVAGKASLPRGLEWADVTRGALARSGGDEVAEAQLAKNVATIFALHGHRDEATSAFERALALAERTGEWADADLFNKLAYLRVEQRRFDEAVDLYQRELRSALETQGPRSPAITLALRNLATTYEERGERAAARDALERARTLARETYGPEDPQTLMVELTLARLEFNDGGRGDAALATARRLLEGNQRVGAPDSFVEDSRLFVAQVLVETGRYAEAMPALARVVAAIEAGEGRDSVDLYEPLLYLGRAERALGRKASARRTLARAAELEAAFPAGPAAKADLLFETARAHDGVDPARACALAGEAIALYRRARAEFVAMPPEYERAAREVQAWLAARARTCPPPPARPP